MAAPMALCKPRGVGERGFTYLWLLMLIAILGWSFALVGTLASTAARREQERRLIATGHEFRNAIGRYYESAAGGVNEYPASLEDLLRDDRFPGLHRHLRRIFVDPITDHPEWVLVRVNGRIVGIHTTSTRAAIKQANFDADDRAFEGQESLDEWIFTYPPDLLLRDQKAGVEAAPTATGNRQTSNATPHSSNATYENAPK